MKYPKISQHVLCRILLFLPYFSPFLLLMIAPATPFIPDLLAMILYFLTSGLAVWRIFYNYPLLLAADATIATIGLLKIDRAEYRTRRNGKDRTQIRKTLLRRCARWGKRFELPEDLAEKMDVYYRNRVSRTVFWSMIEKRVVVCTTDTLSATQYNLLAARARRVLSSVPRGSARFTFQTKAERKAPRVQASVVLFLADTVEDEVKKLARTPLTAKTTDDFCILPCVIQCSDGCYYTNCTGEYYDIAMGGRPAKDFAAAMIRRLVFGRRLPKTARDTQSAASSPAIAKSPFLVSVFDMSFWEFIKYCRHELQEAGDRLEKDRAKAAKRMQNGETRLGDGVIWYMQEGKLAEYMFLPDDDDETLVTLTPDPVWYRISSDFIGVSFNRRKMKNDEREKVQKIMETRLIAEGYRIAGVD